MNDTGDYRFAIAELSAIKASLDAFLLRGRQMAHRGMKEVSPGTWINEKFVDLDDCLRHIMPMLEV